MTLDRIATAIAPVRKSITAAATTAVGAAALILGHDLIGHDHVDWHELAGAAILAVVTGGATYQAPPNAPKTGRSRRARRSAS